MTAGAQGVTITGLDHAQITAPRGCEEQARAFYGATLGLREVAKPAALAGRGGVWFQVGDQQLHIGVEDDFTPQRKAHPAFRVTDLAAVRARLEAAGAPIAEDVPLPGRMRFETRDPFGNRLEFQQLLGAGEDEAASDGEMVKARARAVFGAHAEGYVTSAAHASGAELARLVELAAPRAEEVALDVSTGGGHVALALAPLVARVVASDLTPRMLAAARDFHTSRGAANVEYVVADAERLPFLDGSFDLVTVRIAPHHYADVARAVREMARVLRPGGRLVLVDNVAPEDGELDALLNDWERRRDPSHVRAYTVAEWRGFVVGAGLRLTHEEVGRKEITFGPWVERTGMPHEARAALEADMLAAPEQARAYFEVAERAGHVERWTMEYVIMRAER
ncbi:MAG TPA: methyltransferase domain-containing protein [Ktedonobacterales bacterium]|nr:methyltransferase domain-containing protein [Ktedonobacterales bacterium]